MSVDFEEHPLVKAIGEGIDELFDSVAREAVTGSAAPASSGSSKGSRAKDLLAALARKTITGSPAPKSATQDLTPEQLKNVSSASNVMR